MEKITIVVPINNAAAYLRQCIDAILEQEFKEFKLILVNDGSTDESANICRECAKKDSRIMVCNQRGLGIGAAKNKGMELAQGEYIMFIDPNSWIEPNLLKEVYELAEAEKVDWVIWSLKTRIYDAHKKLIDSKNVQATELICRTENECRNQFVTMTRWDDLLMNATWNKLYKREIIMKNQLKFWSMRKEQDIIFNLAYFEHCGSLISVPTIYSDYQMSDEPCEYRTVQRNYENIYFTYLRYRQLLSLWKEEKEEREWVDFHFLSDIFMLMKQCMKPSWKLSFFKKYAYIKNLMRKVEVKEVAKNVIEQDQSKSLNGRLLRWKIKCVKKQKVLRMVVIYYIESIFGRKKEVNKIKELSNV